MLTEIIAEANRQGLKANHLAERTGRSLSSMQLLLSGGTSPRIDTLEAVAAVLGIEIVVPPAGKVAVRRKGQ